MEERIQFNRQKFKDVVHFIIHHVTSTHGIDALGNTKLHKALYYADFLNYLEQMQPMTGCDYQRQKFGPTARYLTWAIDCLCEEGRLNVETVNYFGYSKRNYSSMALPKEEVFSKREKLLLVSVADFVCAHTAAEVSEFSHDDVWSSVKMGERIPYYAVFAMIPAEVTDDDLAAAKEEFENSAHELEAERRAGNFV